MRGRAAASSSSRAARTAGWFGAPRVSSASSWVSTLASQSLPGGEPGGGDGEGGQLRGVGQVLLGEQVRPQRVPVAGPGVQPVRPRRQRLGPDPGDLGLVRQRRQQGGGARLVGGGGQRGQRDHLVGQRQVRVEEQMRFRAQLVPAGPFPLTQRPQQPLPDRRTRLSRGAVVARGAVPARARRRRGGGHVHRAQQRGDVDQQRFGVRRISQLGRRRRVGRPRPGAAVGGERGAGAAEVLGPVGERDGMAVQVQDRVGVVQLLLADQPVPPVPRGPRQQQQPDRRPGIVPPQVVDQGGDQAGAQVGVIDHQQRRPLQPVRGGAVPALVIGQPGVPPGHQHLHARLPAQPGLARPAAAGHQQHRPAGRALAPAGDLIQHRLAAQERHQPVLRAQQRGRRRAEPAADRPVGRGQADRLPAGQPQIPARPRPAPPRPAPHARRAGPGNPRRPAAGWPAPRPAGPGSGPDRR